MIDQNDALAMLLAQRVEATAEVDGGAGAYFRPLLEGLLQFVVERKVTVFFDHVERAVSGDSDHPSERGSFGRIEIMRFLPNANHGLL